MTGLRSHLRACSSAGRLSAGLLAVALLLAGSVRLADAVRTGRDGRRDRSELSLFPHGPWVRPAALGRARLAADLAWLRAIQYYGEHRRSDRNYPYAETLFATLTDLDPGFEAAYIFGALVLSEEAGQPEAARALLTKGMRENPDSWRLCFEYGFFAFVDWKDLEAAAFYLRRAGRMQGAPESVARLAAHAAGRAGRREMAVALWEELLRQTDNEEVREVARRRLRELGAGAEPDPDPSPGALPASGRTPGDGA